MEMNKNSLFAVLLRSPWWVSLLAALATAMASRFMLAKFDMPEAYAIFVALPFIVIGCVAGWKQLRAPSETRIAGTLESLRALSLQEFLAALETAFRHDGYEVKRLKKGTADLELSKSGRISLVTCKRWKADRTGVEPLRELAAERQARDAQECIYVVAGGITDNALAFAAQSNIRLVHGADLAALLPGRPGGKAK
jgi:restriction system protein